MVAPYNHAEMPPVLRRTAADRYVLEGQSGVEVASFDQAEMEIPGGFWSELVDAMASNYATPTDAIHDLTLLSVRQDWVYVDDRPIGD